MSDAPSADRQILNGAIWLIQAGRAAEADRFCRQLIDRLPTDPLRIDALVFGVAAAAAESLGDTARAASLHQRAVDTEMAQLNHLLDQGIALEAAGQLDPAIALYEQAAARFPSDGAPFTRLSIARLRREFGWTRRPPSTPPPTGRRLTMSKLGSVGRFGNSLLQYAVTRLYAERHGRHFAVPDWVGAWMFDLDDALLEGAATGAPVDDAMLLAALNGDRDTLPTDTEATGTFTLHTGPLAAHRDQFRRYFCPRAELQAAKDAAIGALRARGTTVVALHLRRGDFAQAGFWIAPETWYREWLAAVWPTLDAPVLYLATDDPATAMAFADYRPIQATDLSPAIPGVEFWTDFSVLTGANRVAISNSSFSFTAAMLNDVAKENGAFLRPVPSLQGLAPFDPWNAPVLLPADA